jgi:MFS family permease
LLRRPLCAAGSLAFLKLIVWFSLVLQGAVDGALAPQLVALRDDVGFSNSLAGVLTGAYTAGMLPGVFSILVLGTRVSARVIYLCGLALIGVSSACFGTSEQFEVLVLARAVQGFGAGICFAGGTAWLTGTGRASERGAMLGLAWGGLTLGSVLGPAVGALAAAAGATSLYRGIGLIFLVLAGAALTIRVSPSEPERTEACQAVDAARGSLWIPLVLLVSPALVIGALNVLVPMIVDGHRGSTLVTTVIFLTAAVIGGISSPLVGRLGDRTGPSKIACVGFVLSAITASGLAVLHGLVALAACTVVYLGIANILCSVPAIAAASSVGLRRGQASVGAAVAMAFAIFETVGAFIAMPSREFLGEALTFVSFGVVACVSLFFAGRLNSGPRAKTHN